MTRFSVVCLTAALHEWTFGKMGILVKKIRVTRFYFCVNFFLCTAPHVHLLEVSTTLHVFSAAAGNSPWMKLYESDTLYDVPWHQFPWGINRFRIFVFVAAPTRRASTTNFCHQDECEKHSTRLLRFWKLRLIFLCLFICSSSLSKSFPVCTLKCFSFRAVDKRIFKK